MVKTGGTRLFIRVKVTNPTSTQPLSPLLSSLPQLRRCTLPSTTGILLSLTLDLRHNVNSHLKWKTIPIKAKNFSRTMVVILTSTLIKSSESETQMWKRNPCLESKVMTWKTTVS
ncbi:hypothetical protein L2E82_27569 [Cichorium intybus]|uniref:Uncharacterized protein n=1 Tax=Cichorium intybus TaxID=13427 RepID=A0ACB9CTQ8_CICIN|nr:hypothetical protein L2E82_27569 [Cichorium intybus]